MSGVFDQVFTDSMVFQRSDKLTADSRDISRELSPLELRLIQCLLRKLLFLCQTGESRLHLCQLAVLLFAAAA